MKKIKDLFNKLEFKFYHLFIVLGATFLFSSLGILFKSELLMYLAKTCFWGGVLILVLSFIKTIKL